MPTKQQIERDYFWKCRNPISRGGFVDIDGNIDVELSWQFTHSTLIEQLEEERDWLYEFESSIDEEFVKAHLFPSNKKLKN